MLIYTVVNIHRQADSSRPGDNDRFNVVPRESLARAGVSDYANRKANRVRDRPAEIAPR
jgi:hypothetical protein